MRRGRAVLVFVRIAFRELAGRVDLADDDVEHGFRYGLTAEISVNDGVHLVGERQFYRRAAAEHDDDLLALLGQSVDEVDLRLRNLYVAAVQTFRLGNFVEAEVDEGNFRLIRKRARFLDKAVVLLAVAVEAGRIARDFKTEYIVSDARDLVLGVGQRILLVFFYAEAEADEGRVELGRVDDGRARALVAGNFGEIAYDGDGRAAGKRQRFVFVAQQHDALARALLCHFVVCVHVHDAQRLVLRTAFERLFRRKHEVEQAVERLVEIFLVQLAVPERRDDAVVLIAGAVGRKLVGYLIPFGERLVQILVGVQAAGHFQLVARDEALHSVVAARPVGNDDVLVSPFVAENVAHEVQVLVDVGAVYHIIRGHYRPRLAFFYRDLERGQVQLAHGAFVHYRIDDHAALFLVVESEMLHAAGYAVGLYSAYVSRRHLAGEQRIFGEIFEVAAAAGVALEVGAGAEQDVDFLVHSFFAQHLAHFLAQFVVPAVSHGRRSGETRRGYGRVQTEVVCGRGLFAYAVRAVGQEHRGHFHVVAVDAVRLPEVLA